MISSRYYLKAIEIWRWGGVIQTTPATHECIFYNRKWDIFIRGEI